MKRDYDCFDTIAEAKDHIIGWLDENKGREINIGDAGFECTEYENRAEVWTYGTEKSLDKAIENWGVSESVVNCNPIGDDYGKELGKTFWESPEKFWCACMITVCENLWSTAINETDYDTNDDVTVDDEFIKNIEFAWKDINTIEDIGMGC